MRHPCRHHLRTARALAGFLRIMGLLAVFLLSFPSLSQAQGVPGTPALPAAVTEGAAVGSGGAVVAGAEAAAGPSIPLLARAADSGLMFNLHGNYYQVSGRANIYSADPRFNAARQRLYQVFQEEWSGYQGILRTGIYASNDGMAHLVAGKQVELLSDDQVAALVVKHLPREAPHLLPAETLNAARSQELVAARNVRALAAVPSRSAIAGGEAAILAETPWPGLLAVAALAIGGAIFYQWWSTHGTLAVP